ncbi:MAG: hypothetical protein MK179_18275 [Pirellulaceae bacterium]|nr:hypothetical protein [Pirellulaceae bacterium]
MHKEKQQNAFREWNRRQFFGTGATLTASAAVATGTTLAAPGTSVGSQHRPGKQPLAQDYTVVTKQPTKEHFVTLPGMVVLDDGTLFATVPFEEWKDKGVLRNKRSLRRLVGGQTHTFRSHDQGMTWEPLQTMAFSEVAPFVYNDNIYMFLGDKNPLLIRSDDAGSTWSRPVQLFEGLELDFSPNVQYGEVVKDGFRYFSRGYRTSVVAADLSQDLMNPTAWRVSNVLQFPGAPKRLRSNLYPPDKNIWPVQWPGDLWLEPNVVNVNGQLRVLLRSIIDEYATANICAVCDLTDDGRDIQLEFTQFAALPGGQNKFFILHDEPSQLFWMLSNIPTDSQGYFYKRDELLKIGFHGGPGNERRILMLHYSRDALNWFSAGCAAKWDSPLQSFMYPTAVVNEDDIVFISRTSKNGQNQHDADLATFHRIKNFRSLAMDLSPTIPAGPNV